MNPPEHPPTGADPWALTIIAATLATAGALIRWQT